MAADLRPGPAPAGDAIPGPEPEAEPPPSCAILRLELHADPQSVRAALCEVLAWLAGTVDEDAAGTLQLVLAEVLNNIVEHAYGGEGGRIGLQLRKVPGGLACRILDEGRAMPDGNLPAPPPADLGALDTDPDFADLPEGGFGWMMIRDLARGLQYRRDGGCNVLQFHVPLA